MNSLNFSTLTAVAAGMLVFTAGGAKAVISTIPVTGWNADMIVGAGDPTTGNGGINATMDGGAALGGFVYYQQGVNAGAPATGLPAAGAIITSATGSGATFTMRPYNANNSLLLDGGTKTLTLSSPTLLNQIAVFGATGNGSGTDTVVIHYADASTQTFSALSGSIGQDWFGGGNTAIALNGRMDPNSGGFDSVNSGNPRIYEALLTLNNTASPVTSVDFTLTGNGHNVIYALSGQTIPEPSGLALPGLAALGAMRRKRRTV
jgi:hypothetical protein